MAESQPKANVRAKRRPPVVQTIEQIERRAVEVREAENEGLVALVHAMREIAVRLPVESRLPAILAERAKRIERDVRLCGGSHSQATAASNELYDLVRDLVADEVGGSVETSDSPQG